MFAITAQYNWKVGENVATTSEGLLCVADILRIQNDSCNLMLRKFEPREYGSQMMQTHDKRRHESEDTKVKTQTNKHKQRMERTV